MKFKSIITYSIAAGLLLATTACGSDSVDNKSILKLLDNPDPTQADYREMIEQARTIGFMLGDEDPERTDEMQEQLFTDYTNLCDKLQNAYDNGLFDEDTLSAYEEIYVTEA